MQRNAFKYFRGQKIINIDETSLNEINYNIK